jgi:hypothetical protein
MRRTADDVIRIGQQLNHMKEKVLPHGSFLPWIEAEFEMTHKTATNFMNVAAKFGAKVEIVSPLVPTALYELASSSAEVQAEVERRIAAGEIISDRTA